MKWIIKVTRSDVNETANQLLRHEKQIFSRLVNDLVNTVKQKSAGFLEGARVSPKELILTPDFIYEETSHAADMSRNVLVLDNLEEKHFFALTQCSLNLAHFRQECKHDGHDKGHDWGTQSNSKWASTGRHSSQDRS